jgi:hypothetical protein
MGHPMDGLITLALTTLSAFIGSYLGAYLRKKGENRAIHEDIAKLVDQVSAVTKATKDIEAKISNEVWKRQKRWELKREVLFEAAKRLAEVDDALLGFDSMLRMGHPEWTEVKNEKLLFEQNWKLTNRLKLWGFPLRLRPSLRAGPNLRASPALAFRRGSERRLHRTRSVSSRSRDR